MSASIEAKVISKIREGKSADSPRFTFVLRPLDQEDDGQDLDITYDAFLRGNIPEIEAVAEQGIVTVYWDDENRVRLITSRRT